MDSRKILNFLIALSFTILSLSFLIYSIAGNKIFGQNSAIKQTIEKKNIYAAAAGAWIYILSYDETTNQITILARQKVGY